MKRVYRVRPKWCVRSNFLCGGTNCGNKGIWTLNRVCSCRFEVFLARLIRSSHQDNYRELKFKAEELPLIAGPFDCHWNIDLDD